MSSKTLTILSLESRMAEAVRRKIESLGATPLMAPSMREVPLEDNAQAFDFFETLESGSYDLVILMTGVGLKALINILETRHSKENILQAFQKTQVVVRGPKPTRVCKGYGIEINITIPPPNTWQEILEILEEKNLLKEKKAALIEYGRRDENFLGLLKERGAQVSSIGVYKWDLPEDTQPLRQAVESILAGEVDVLIQTSAVQIDHLMKMIKDVPEELRFRRALAKVAHFSIGPTTSAHLRERQLFPDQEVFPNKWEHLVEEAIRFSPQIIERKLKRAEKSWARLEMGEGFSDKESQALWEASPMMKACRREPVEQVPIWLMRQAGRYMEEYQLIRRGKAFLEFCKDPDLCTEAALSAVERLGVDAAILFSDILPLVEPMGMDLDFVESLGPVFETPLRSLEAIQKLKPVDPEQDLSFALKAVRQTRLQLHPRIPLIGFSGAPFTLASYMIEGRSSRHFIVTKQLMHNEPKAWHLLMEKLTRAVIDYLRAQAKAGCQILQIFDSWVGCLSPSEYGQFVFPYMKEIFSGLPKDNPSIHFGTGTATLLALQKEAGGDVIGLDWRMDPLETWSSLGEIGIQGNLDPVLLFCEKEKILSAARDILDKVGDRPGFIFNLGHGILPETPVEHVMALVDFVKGWRKV